MRITESSEYIGVRVQLDLVCQECGDVDNWIAIYPGEYREQVKNFKKAMRLAGWSIGNFKNKRTLCPDCNKNRDRKTGTCE